MNYAKLLYGLITVLGIVFAALFFPNPIAFPFLNLATSVAHSFIGEATFSGTVTWMLLSCFCSILGAVLLPAGLCGVCSQYFRNNQHFSTLQASLAGDSKGYSKLFRFIAVSGATFLITFVTMLFLIMLSKEVDRFFMSTYPYGAFLMVFGFLLGGTCLLTVGVCGSARKHFKIYRNSFTILVAILIPSLILMPFTYLWIGSLTVGF